jgi:dihydrofolate reductase
VLGTDTFGSDMGNMVYAAITSLDGYVADRDGSFTWAEPDEEVHAAVNDLQRSVGTYLLGRRMYEVLAVWETFGDDAHEPSVVQDYARIWRAADKIVYSAGLLAASTPRTTIEASFDPDRVARLKAESASDLSVGGPGLAAHAIAAGLVDDFHVFLNPVVVGGGTPWLPQDARLDLTLVGERRFTSGVVHLHYRTAQAKAG